MLRHSKVLLFVCAVVCCAGFLLLKGEPEQLPSGKWLPVGAMTSERAGACAALLPDGRVLITGGIGPAGALTTAEFFGPDGSFTPAAEMGSPRSSHACTTLGDGRILISGGVNNGGSLNTAEIYDPRTNKWEPAGDLLVARSGHTATLLQDGRVLLAGGDSAGVALAALEIFNPAANSFDLAARSLSSPREKHAAVRLKDGRVLIAGGTDGTNALASVEVFDPMTGAVVPAGKMTVPRMSLSATLQFDGRVFLAGGNDGKTDLASTEIYDPARGGFTASAPLTAPRSGHRAFRIPNNNGILLAGGTSEGVALQSSDLFIPWTGALRPTGALSNGRLLAAGSVLRRPGAVLLSGGARAASAEVYMTATVMTDKADYQPGDTVLITGSGWTPGETVTLNIVESPDDGDGPHILTPTADATGNISATFPIEANDIGITFTLTATGGTSGLTAQTTFTDTTHLKAIKVLGAQTPNPVAAGNSATYGTTASNSIEVDFNGNGSCPVTLSATGLPTGATATFAPSALTGTGTSSLFSLLTINTTTALSGGTYSFTVRADGTGGDCPSDSATAPASLVVNTATTTSVVSSLNPSTYGTGVSFTATVTRTAGSGTPTGSVQFKIDGSPFGGPVALGAPTTSTSATAVSGSTSTLKAGSHTITAEYTPSGSFAPSSGTVNQTVNPKALTITATTNTKTYDGTTSAAAVPTVSGLVGSDTVTGLAETYDNKNAGTGKTLTVSPGYTVNDGNGGNNYTVTTVTNNTGVITKAALTITAATNSKVCDGTTSAAAVPTTSGLVGGDTVTGLAETYDTKHVGTGKTLSVSAYTVNDGNSGNNYTVTTVTNTTGVITKAALTITAATNSKVYDGTTSAAAVPTTSGLVGGDTVTGLAETYDTKHVGIGKTLSVSAYTVNDGNSGNNYTVTTVADTTGVITKAALTITAVTNTKTYDGTTSAAAAPTVSGLQTGDTVTGLAETYDNKNAGTSKTLTVSAYTVNDGNGGNNYTVTTVTNTTGVINQRGLTVSATGVNKVYDGNTGATVTLSDNRVAGDSISTSYGSAAFADKNVGVGKTVTVTGISISGADAGNYTFNTTTTTTANITARPLTITAAGVNKVYDGTATATVTLSDNRIAGDAFTDSYTTAAFTNKNAGTGKTVNVSGISISGADAGNYTFNTTATTTADITQRPLTVTATGVDKVYDGTVTATVTFSDNRIGGDVLTVSDTATFADKNVGNGKLVSVSGIFISGGADAGNYSLSNTTATTTANITPRPLTITATGVDKVYDGTTTATVNLSDNRVAGDVFTDSYASASFNNKTVGMGKTVTVTGISISGADAGNYTFNTTTTTTANITARPLTVTAAGSDKVYDGTTAATVTLSDNRIAGDMFADSYTTAAFTDKNAGNGKTINVSGISIAGADAGNYTFNTTTTATANITPRPLTVTVTGINKVYDGTTAASVTFSDNRIGGDVLTVSDTATFADKNVGNGKLVSVSGIFISGGADAGNYSLSNTTATTTANITPRPLTITATGVSKVYDGTTTATVNLSDNRVAGDVFTDSYASASFNNKTVGMGKTVTVTGISISGADAGNYTFNTTTTTTANITARPLTVTAAGSDKVYDGTTAATVTLSDNRIAGDMFADSYTTAAFTDKNAGNGKTINVSGISIAGADAGNYTFNTTTTATANITPRPLTVTVTGINKVYDGTTAASVTFSDNRIGGDVLTVSDTATFA